ncbi:MAG: CarD family transcriptional regulator [Candidatus Accumulibacter sp.]|jgi:CarD family transcriptional regulator|nr:CarD family transcriptional regulator [Accumulibacter sp.]
MKEYRNGENVVYGRLGVCRIVDIAPMDSGLDAPERLYYVLQPVFDKIKVYVPTDDGAAPMRKALTRAEADALIDAIPDMKVKPKTFTGSAAGRDLTEHYREKLESRRCVDLIELTMSIYAKKQRGKCGSVDKSFMKQAEDLLFGELSVALGIEKEGVPAYIGSRVARRQPAA